MDYCYRDMAMDDLNKRLCETEQENAELRAQLARCVGVVRLSKEIIDERVDNSHFTDMQQVHEQINSVLESLPATASLDAEILRCAKKQVSR